MAPKTASDSKTQITTTDEIEEQLAYWRKNGAVTWKGEKGTFVKSSELEECMRFLLDRVRHDPTEQKWPDLIKQVNDLKQEAKNGNGIMASLRHEIKEKSAAYEEAAGANEKWQHAWENQKEWNDRELRSLRSELKAAQEARVQSLKDLTDASKGFDPDAAVETQKKHESTKESLSLIQGKLEEMNKEKKRLSDENSAFKSSQKEHVKEMAKLRKELDDLSKVRHQAFGESDLPGVPLPTIKSKVVAKMIGDKGLAWLRDAEAAMRSDQKDRALKLMNAARSSRDRNLKSIADLLEIVFQWLRRQTWRARGVLAGWIDMIHTHLAEGKVKSIAFYRDELQRIVQAHKLDIEKLREKKTTLLEKNQESEEIIAQAKEAHPTFFEGAWIWVSVCATRVKRIFVAAPKAPANTVPPFSKFLNSCSSFIGRLLVRVGLKSEDGKKRWRRPSVTEKDVEEENQLLGVGSSSSPPLTVCG